MICSQSQSWQPPRSGSWAPQVSISHAYHTKLKRGPLPQASVPRALFSVLAQMKMSTPAHLFLSPVPGPQGPRACRVPFCFTPPPPAGVSNPGGCPPLLEWAGTGQTADFSSARTEQQINVITCQEKDLTSQNSSLLEMPIHKYNHPPFFQMFLTRMQSRYLGARQTDWGLDKGLSSSGTSFGSAHLTCSTSSTPARRDGAQPHWRTPGTAPFPGHQ